ncbi:PREDICTED: chymotrypsin-1-like [Ceratosolen solmsi marchali]|uniref:Chymotrypsin-1-like n=1 Tax=Ceratosolen solmsi marchali TaxID=326594 RepID=A0AAJ6YQC8_9HYME|nr:PREDICTED: chymotrypsin-1-like [Ceratosolen solmsi marchali]
MDLRLAVFLFITSFIEIFSEIVSIKDFPYQVLLKYKNVPFCGGSIISNRHVLSAAHCVFGKSKNFPDMTVHTGTTYITDDSTAYFIYRVDIHPKFTGKLTKPYVYCNDIAVITSLDYVV